MRLARMVIATFLPNGNCREFEEAAAVHDELQERLAKVLAKRLTDEIWEVAYDFAESCFALWKAEYSLLKLVQDYIKDRLDKKFREAADQSRVVTDITQALHKKEIPRGEALEKLKALRALHEKQGTGFSSAHRIDVQSLRIWQGRCRTALGALARIADVRFPLPTIRMRTDIPFSEHKPNLKLGLVQAVDEIEVRARLFADNAEDTLVEQVEKDKATKVRRMELGKWAKEQELQSVPVLEAAEVQSEKVEFDGVKTKAKVAVHERATIPVPPKDPDEED